MTTSGNISKSVHGLSPINSGILTIAGLDPSSGAGLTSDIKTFEAHKLYGLSVCTAVTVQNDVSFKDCIWIEESVILAQIDILFKRFSISVVKIGIIQSWDVLLGVVQRLKAYNPEIKIILDPILKASSGFNFNSESDYNLFLNVLDYCYFITPNYDEIQALFPNKSVADTIEIISQRTNIYLKGGHRSDKVGWDEIYHSGIVQINLKPELTKVYNKHGSGCVLSAALASNIAKSIEMEDACRFAKRYTEQFLNSNASLLGTHNYTIYD